MRPICLPGTVGAQPQHRSVLLFFLPGWLCVSDCQSQSCEPTPRVDTLVATLVGPHLLGHTCWAILVGPHLLPHLLPTCLRPLLSQGVPSDDAWLGHALIDPSKGKAHLPGPEQRRNRADLTDTFTQVCMGGGTEHIQSPRVLSELAWFVLSALCPHPTASARHPPLPASAECLDSKKHS